MRKQIYMNLATHPVRNRRFFFLVSGFLAAVFIIISLTSGYSYLKHRSKNKNFMASASDMEKRRLSVQLEEKRLASQIENASNEYQEQIDLLNSLIFKKSFSWLDFLSALEKALPESCFIASLAPSLKEDSKMEVRLKVASPNLDELLKFNKNLYDMNFSNILTISESRDEVGFLVSEISLVYERNN